MRVRLAAHRGRQSERATCDKIGDMTQRAVSWPQVLARLVASRSYWLTTVNPDGAPHVAPVWGAVVSPTLHLYSERRTVKARNLTLEPRAVVHLESAEDVVIVHGVLEDIGAPAGVPDVLRALAEKYDGAQDAQYLPSNNPAFDIVYALRPRLALLWNLEDYEASQQRWSAG